MRCLIVCLCFSLCWSSPTRAQSKVAAIPIVGLRDNPVESVALIHADVVVEPGKTLTDATVLIEGTSITAVGVDLEIPTALSRSIVPGKGYTPGSLILAAKRRCRLRRRRRATGTGTYFPNERHRQRSMEKLMMRASCDPRGLQLGWLHRKAAS